MVLCYIRTTLIGYLIGCVSFGYIFAKLFKGKDIRDVGSGNAGTANVIRNYGWVIGLLTFIGDVAKGAGAAYIGYLLCPQVSTFRLPCPHQCVHRRSFGRCRPHLAGFS